MSHIIRSNAGKKITTISELFIKQRIVFNFVYFSSSQTLLHCDNWCVFVCFYLEPPCEAIEVTADSYISHQGIYVLTDEKISDNPVWKIQLGDRYIFNTGRGKEGYRIGSKSSLPSGSFYCKGKVILILFTISCTLVSVFTPAGTNVIAWLVKIVVEGQTFLLHCLSGRLLYTCSQFWHSLL